MPLKNGEVTKIWQLMPI